MESCPIYNCPKGIPKEFLNCPLPFEIKNVQYMDTAAKVTVAYMGCVQDEMSAFYLPMSHKVPGGVEFKRVVLLRNNFEYDWDYNCRRELHINQSIETDLYFRVDEKVRHVFITIQDLENEHDWATQQAPGSFCVLF